MKKIKTIGAVSCALISGSALASSLLLTSCSKQKPDSSTQHDSGDAFVPYYFNLDSIYLNILNFRGVFRAFTQAALIKDQTYTRAMMGVNVGDEFYDIMEQKLLNGTIDEPDTTIPSDIQQKITQFMSTFDSYMSNETIKKFADDFQSLATKNSHSKQITYSDFRESFLNTLNSSSTFWQSWLELFNDVMNGGTEQMAMIYLKGILFLHSGWEVGTNKLPFMWSNPQSVPKIEVRKINDYSWKLSLNDAFVDPIIGIGNLAGKQFTPDQAFNKIRQQNDAKLFCLDNYEITNNFTISWDENDLKTLDINVSEGTRAPSNVNFRIQMLDINMMMNGNEGGLSLFTPSFFL